MKVGPLIAPHQKDDFRIRIAVLEILDGIDGVGVSYAIELTGIDSHAGIARNDPLDHGCTMLARFNRLASLLPRFARDPKEAIQRKRFDGAHRQLPMRTVHRIESAAEKSDFVHAEILPQNEGLRKSKACR